MRTFTDPVLDAMAHRRSGPDANATPVREAHGLAENELLMGWLYVGEIDPAFKERLASSKRPPLDPERFLGRTPRR